MSRVAYVAPMSDTLPADRSADPVTVSSLAADLRSLGVTAGDVVLVHASLSALGWVCGGAPAVVDALQRVVTTSGTVVMPTHSPGNRDPTNMNHPPVPDAWAGTIREELPAYRPEITPTQGMGAIAECFRSYPGVERSDHPQHSFAAWGANATAITDAHALDYSLGERSPLARVYEHDGDVCFLGTTHRTNTSLHLAEYRADVPIEQTSHGSAIVLDGDREWVEWTDLGIDDTDFPRCGTAFDRDRPDAVQTGTVGVAAAKRLSQRALVDYAVDWFEANRS
jgi:aminoglycoside 3-N-acetyltransferase